MSFEEPPISPPQRVPGLPAARYLAGLVLAAGVACYSPGSAAEPLAPPTLALEDTLPAPRIQLRQVEVRAVRLSLDQILDRIVEGEARRDSLIHDEVYDVYVRMLERDTDRDTPRKTLLNQVSRVFRQQPHMKREIIVKRSGREDLEVSAGQGMREQIIKFAFDPALRKLYRFRIVGRDFAGGHIVYRLEFEPRSDFYKLPTGRLWVDTNEFVILREEFWYRGTSPAPLVFKSLDNFTVERTRVDGRFWVISRVMGRVTFTLPILGIPPQGDMVISYQNYRINKGIDPKMFAGVRQEKVEGEE